MAKMATLENLEAKISFSRPTMVCVLEGGGGGNSKKRQ